MDKGILTGILVVGVVLISACAEKNPAESLPNKLLEEKYCEKDQDCLLFDPRCCPAPTPCTGEPTKALNKEGKEKAEQETRKDCPSNCPHYEPSRCPGCLNIEKFAPLCVKNECTVKKEIDCEQYCKATEKDQSEPCPLISNKNLLTHENAELCKCPEKRGATIATDKTEYGTGEQVTATLRISEQAYVPFGGEAIKFHRTNSQTPALKTHCETTCMDTCEGGTLKKLPCPQYAPPLYAFHEYAGPTEVKWRQTECAYENKKCGNDTYQDGALKQVPAGNYVARFCYYREEDINLSEPPGTAKGSQTCAETKFTIKEQ